MRKTRLLKHFFLLFAMIVGSTSAWADDVLVYTLDTSTVDGSGNNYNNENTATVGDIGWAVYGNLTENPWRIGGKSLSEVDRTAKTTTKMGEAISKVALTIGGTNSGITVNSLKLIVASDADFNTQIDEVSATFALNSTINFTPSASVGTVWPKDAFYKFVFNVTVSGTSNKYFQFSKVEFYKTVSGPIDPTITISSTTLTVGGTATISGPSDLSMSFETSDNSVASVDADGVVTGVAVGEATITATWDAVNTYNAGSQEFTVTVADATVYEKVTDASQLVAGNEYILVATGSNVAMGAQDSKLRKYVTVTINDNKVEITDEAVAVLTLGGSTGAWTFLASDNSQYLALNANSNEVHASNDATLSTSKWTITDDFQLQTDAQSDTRYLRYNSGSPRFACYKSGQVVAVLFVKSGGSTDEKLEPGYSFSATSAEATLGEDFTAPTFNNPNGISVTFDSSDKSVATISATGEVEILAGGSTTISASSEADETYKEGYAYYTLTVIDPDAPGTENNPYTVAQARAAIDAGTGTQGVYAKGFVSEIVEAYNSQYENITFTISADGTTTADQLEAYRCKGSTNYPADNVHVGDEVVIYGNLTKYGSTYEFAQNCQIVALTSYTGTPIITAPSEITLEAEATSGEFAYSITNPIAGETLTAEVSTDVDWISNIQVTADKVTFTVSPNQIADKRMTVMYLNYESADPKNVTIHQKAYIQPGLDYATLPFEFDGGKNDVDPCDGLSQDGLASDYSSSPYLKFDSTGDWLLLHFNESPGTLTFDIKGNTFSGGTFTVQTSVDGTTYTDLKSYTELGDTQHESFDNLGEDVRYIKWIYTNKSSGNVALGNISLDQYDPTPSITVNPNVVNATAAESDGTLTVTYKNVEVSAGVEVQFCNANGGDAEYDWIDAEINDENNVDYIVFENTGEARTAYLKVYGLDAETNNVYSNIVTITQAAPVTERSRYEKVTSTDDLTDGQYLIVYEDGSLAFDGDLDALDAEGNTIEVEIADDMIVASTTTRAAEFTIVKEADADTYTIKSASGFYIGQSSDSNGMKVSETTSYSHSISFSGTNNDADLVSNGAHLRFNSASNQNRFRYYKSSSYANQQAIQLYKYIPVTVPVTVTEYKWATLSSEYAMDFSAMTDLKAYIVTGDNGSTILTEEVSGKVKAGTGLLIYSEKAGNYDIPIAAEAGTDYSDSNKLIAVTKKMTVNKADDGTTNYVLTVNNDKAVFAYINNTPAVLRKGQAYLNLEGEPSAPYLGFDGEGTTGIVNVNRETITNNQYYTLDGRRVENPSNGVYIVNGKKVVIK
jgi:hypothetical protein